MGLTKRRFSKARTASRRAHFRVQPVTLVECPQCHARMVPHRVCPTCGYYAGRQVIEVKAPEEKPNT
ncbi:MAG: 50S ribosomal protein L32 [Bacillati bacterium ANGP1]|uniref:Large ribosomal subunit protein bL32 n=1 Tax=Candidatus Segetimicrobium genomatis TaxID=2569760 RepID=A0A537JZW8_9BACT|nr:MAG: 50S ribosomal protein L32 [Terrabacteria group bacterium ANGP1]